MNLNGKLRKKLGGQAKIWGGHGPPRPPLRIATARDARPSHLLTYSMTTFSRKFTNKAIK